MCVPKLIETLWQIVCAITPVCVSNECITSNIDALWRRRRLQWFYDNEAHSLHPLHHHTRVVRRRTGHGFGATIHRRPAALGPWYGGTRAQSGPRGLRQPHGGLLAGRERPPRGRATLFRLRPQTCARHPVGRPFLLFWRPKTPSLMDLRVSHAPILHGVKSWVRSCLIAPEGRQEAPASFSLCIGINTQNKAARLTGLLLIKRLCSSTNSVCVLACEKCGATLHLKFAFQLIMPCYNISRR